MSDPLVRRVCTECRNKKTRCDGQYPRCGKCSKARGAPLCIYESERPPPKLSSALQRGAACLPCRRKKKKCDAERPVCLTCKTANKADQCGYDEGYSYAYTLLEKTQELEERLARLEHNNKNGECPSDLAVHSTGPHGTTSSDESTDPPDTSAGETWKQPIADPTRPPGLPSYSIEPLLMAYGGTDLNGLSQLRKSILLSGNKIRNLAMQHRSQMCLSLVGLKSYCVENGDLSATIVQPALIHLAHLIGFLFWQDREGKFDNALEESLAEAVEKALSALEHSHSAASTEIYAVIQVLCGLAYYHLLRNRVPDAEKYVNKAISALCKADLQATIEAVRGAFPEHSVLSSGIFLEARSPAEEHVAAIAQIVFLDNTVALIAERDTLVAVEYVTALSSLRTVSPAVWRSNLAVLRARATCLLVGSRLIRQQWKESGSATSEEQRNVLTQSYWDLLNDINELEGALQSAVLRVTLDSNLDRQHEVALKCSLMTAHCAKAALHLLLPAHLESRKMALDAVCQIITITEQLEDRDIGILDFLVAYVWCLSSTVFLRENEELQATKSTLINREAIIAALATIARGYLRFEMYYPIIRGTRAVCDMPYDPELKSLVMESFLGT